MIKTAILIAGLSGIFVLLSNKKDGMLLLGESKNKAVKNNKDKTKNEDLTVTGITITKKWELPKQLTEISGLSNLDD
ncbi:MAG TPA: hypothetical protein VFO37_12640, partial [Chitinophagaceae bacterium]|nr:hypothetical protein [Chitinophagaceae bacterium]